MSYVALKDWLSSLGVARVHSSFKEIGVKGPEDLSLLSDSSLDEMLKALELTTMERMKLTIAVRKLEATKFRHTVITPDEDKAMKQLSATTAQARDILAKVQITIKATNKSSLKAKNAIIQEFKSIYKTIQQREKELLALLNIETKSKIDALNKQSMQISTILSQCAQAERNSNKLLTISDVHKISKREEDIRKAITNVLNTKIDTQPVRDPDLMLVIDSNPLTKMALILGDIVSGAVPNPPKITIIEAIRNTVKVSWEPEIPNLEQPGSGVSLKTGNVLRYCAKISDHEAKCAEGEVVWEKELVCEAKQQTRTFEDLKPEHQYAVQLKAMNDINKTWGKFGVQKIVKTKKTYHVWNPLKKANDLQINGNQLARLNSNNGNWRMCLCETVYTNGKHSFGVKLLQTNNSKRIMIGIAPQNTNINPSANHCHYYYPNSYAYSCYDGLLYQYKGSKAYGTAIPNQSGDVIRVTVDMDNKTLQFAVNGKDCPLENISIPGPACPAVALSHSACEVEIL